MPEPVHTYPSNHRPGTTWALTEAWKILDALPPGVLNHDTRAYLAAAIAATLMFHLRAATQPETWTAEAIVAQINAREAASLEALRREAEDHA